MPIDYDALAKQAGAISAAPSVAPDYDALAKQAGATESHPIAHYVADRLGEISDELRSAATGPLSTVLGAYDVLRKIPGAENILPDVSPAVRQFVAPVNSPAGRAGRLQEQAAEFFLPVGEAAKLAEVATAARAARLGKVASKVAPVLARAGAEGLATAGVTALQTGGDPKAVIESGVAAGATGAALHGAAQLYKTALEAAPKPLSEGAVRLAKKLGVPLTRGMIGGSKAVQGTEKILGSTVAGDLYDPIVEKGQEALRAGASQLSKGFGTDRFSAGGSTAQSMLGAAQQLHDVSQDEYANFERLASDPANARQVQTGTKTVNVPGSNLVGPDGRPAAAATTVEQPVIEKIALPTDMRPVKQAIAPEVEAISRRMTPAQRRMDPGLSALQNILDRPDVLGAVDAEGDLSYLKSIGRSDATDQAKRLATVAVRALQPEVDRAAARAGDDALASLQRARSSWGQHAEILDLVKRLSGDASGKTGQVRLANRLLQPGDAAWPDLQKVLNIAPEAAGELGRAYLSERVFKGVADGSDTINAKQGRNLWNQIGARTKAALYPPQQISDIDHFFELAKRLEDTGASKSGILSNLTRAGVFLAKPVEATLGLAFGRNIAKILYYPDGAAALNQAIEGAGRSGGSAALRRIESIVNGGENGRSGPTAGGAGTEAGAVDPGAAQSRSALPESVRAGAAAPAKRTTIDVPGEARTYAGQYEVRDLSQVQPSHHGATFQPNPKYELRNDRDYDNPVNQAKIVDWAAKGPTGFKPSNLINTVPDSSSGPPVIDSRGNVLGGNGRTMILQRVYRSNPEGAAAYRELLNQQAAQFGIDPARIAEMKNPVLVRAIDDAEFAKPGASKQAAVTDFNKTGTAALTPSERSIADSRRVSVSTLEDVARRLEDKGPDATLAQVLEGGAGGEVLAKLVSDGVISPQERAALVTERGLTKAGKDRISALMLGRFFSDPGQMDELAPALRNKVERIAAPLARTEGPEGFDLSQHMRDAIDLIEGARAHGAATLEDFIRQTGLFGDQRYSPEAVILAHRLQEMKPTALTNAVRSYAEAVKYAREYQGPGLFGNLPAPLTPAEAFAFSFGK